MSLGLSFWETNKITFLKKRDYSKNQKHLQKQKEFSDI